MNILIVKLSSLGDVVHAMAAVQDIRAALPRAQIDWVVERGFAPLVRRCNGVRRVIPCELRRWRKDMLSQTTRQALFHLVCVSQASRGFDRANPSRGPDQVQPEVLGLAGSCTCPHPALPGSDA